MTQAAQQSSPSQSRSAPVQKSPAPSSGASSQVGGGSSRKTQMVAGATSFEEGEARLAPGGAVQMDTAPGATTEPVAPGAADGAKAGEGGEAKAEEAGAPKTDRFAKERAELEAAGRAALAGLPETSAADAGKTPGNVGQGTVEAGGALPDWFMEIQNRLVASTSWGEAEEKAQHAIRDYAMLVAREHAGPDGKVPGHIKAFFDYIGRGTKNDAAAKKGGYKGSSALNGAKGAKNWCAGAATQASNIAKKEGRDGVIADLASRGLAPSTMPTIFFDNLAKMSGSQKSKMFYNDTAFAQPLEPGDRVDYLFDGCQYGGHAVHVVADLGDSFLHVSGNTTRHSAVATGQAQRLKTKPEGLKMGVANDVSSDESKKKATEHIKGIKFGGGKLVYMIQRSSDPYKALEMLATDDSAAFEVALKKLLLKRIPMAGDAGAKAPTPAAGGGGGGAPAT